MSNEQSNHSANADDIFRGVPLAEIPNLFQQPPILCDMQDVRDEDHSFLIKPFKFDPSNPNQEPEPIHGIDTYKDIWNDDHVYLPCSSFNLTNDRVPRWPIIQKALTHLKQKCEAKVATVNDIKEAIEKCNGVKIKIGCLRQVLNQTYLENERVQFMSTVLPKMISLALDVDKICSQPPVLLRIHSSRSVTMSQRQAGSLLACGFFCLFPYRPFHYQTYQSLNFTGLLKWGALWKVEKLNCILNYFRRITEKMPTGVLTFRRFALPDDWRPNWKASQAPLCKLHIKTNTTIEQMEGLLQVDFANEFIGGGVMDEGIVQEEIRFTICPEMLISILLSEVMLPNECIFLIGCEQFTSYTGYADTFKAEADFVDTTWKDSWGRKLSQVVAMDAICFNNPLDQYTVQNMSRELIKAYTSFRIPRSLQQSMFGIATGNWGCGAFNGDRELKAIIQLMAASESARSLVYVTWHDQDLMESFWTIYEYLTKQQATVGDLCMYLKQYSTRYDESTLFEFILSTPVYSAENNTTLHENNAEMDDDKVHPACDN